MSDYAGFTPLWGVERLDGKPWPDEGYRGETVENGRVLVCTDIVDAVACTLHPGEPGTHDCRVVHWEYGTGWMHVPDDLLRGRLRNAQELARKVADAVEERTR